jgi:4-hydroxybenzoate polyprenyltransferase
MALSRHEVGGAPVRVPFVTLAVSAATAVATAVPVARVAGGSAAVCRRAADPPSWLVAQFPAPLKGVVGAASSGKLRTTPAAKLRAAPSAKLRAAVTVAGALAYLGTYGSAQVRAVKEPSGENVRRAVGAGILGLMPLQAALTARGGAPVVAAALGVVHPLARRLARRISPT